MMRPSRVRMMPQFATVAIELFGMGVASRHHGGALGDAQIGLPQPHARTC